MKEIPLTQGFVALVDDEDYAPLASRKWHALRDGRRVYAQHTYRAAGVTGHVAMHRMLLPDAARVDHINGNGLDNRRANLRASTATTNGQNRRANEGASSPRKGVGREGQRWRARIRVGGTLRHLGTFADPTVAARAYDDAARHYFGEFAALNFPREGEVSA